MKMKIPPNAKRVFKGIIFDVYQWQQEMFDGSFETFEMLKRANTIEVIAVQDDKILLSRQSQPNKPNFYALFGGRAEEGEEPLATAQRELLEESGLTSADWELFKTYQPIHKIDWQIYTYIARDCQKATEPHLDPGEKIETVSYDFDQFIELMSSDRYWGSELAFDILKMKEQGKLDELKHRLFRL